MILNHLELLSAMRDQVQVELTITTLDERVRKVLEGNAPSVGRRLAVIKRLSDAGIFVRVMCMPFIGDRDAARNLRDVTFGFGAKGFKHKSMNYWDEAELLKGNVVRVKGRKDSAYEDLLVKGGEPYLSDGKPKMVSVLMPRMKGKFSELENKPMVIENHGYADINKVNWRYLI